MAKFGSSATYLHHRNSSNALFRWYGASEEILGAMAVPSSGDSDGNQSCGLCKSRGQVGYGQLGDAATSADSRRRIAIAGWHVRMRPARRSSNALVSWCNSLVQVDDRGSWHGRRNWYRTRVEMPRVIRKSRNNFWLISTRAHLRTGPSRLAVTTTLQRTLRLSVRLVRL